MQEALLPYVGIAREGGDRIQVRFGKAAETSTRGACAALL